jgi:malonyl-CoA/methylmalonyl-CoA synthetase
MTENLFDLLDLAFRLHPDRIALTVPGRAEISYGDLRSMSGDYAALLESLGVGAGDRVLVQVDKSAEAVGLYLGCLRRGAIYVPINTAYTPEEVAYFLRDAKPALFVCPLDNENTAVALALSEAGEKGRDIRVLSLGTEGDGTLLEALEDSADWRAGTGTAGRLGCGGDPVHLRHHGPLQRRHVDPRQPGDQRGRAGGLLGVAG